MPSFFLNQDDLRRIFVSMDRNGDGVVCLDELNTALETIVGSRFTAKELECVMGKATLDFEEFLLFYKTILLDGGTGNRGTDEEDEEEGSEMLEAFKVFDENGDGFISSEKLQRVLDRLGMSDGKDCKSMICVYDLDSDGRLDFNEFKKMMTMNRVP